jgi:site-specific recombinase XerD
MAIRPTTDARPQGLTTGVVWSHDLDRWIHYLRVIGLSPRTIQAYRRTLICFIADTFLDLDAVTEDDIVEYLVRDPVTGEPRSQQGHGPGAILRALRSYYGWAARRTGRPSPVDCLKPKRVKYGPAPSLTEDEVTRILIAAAWRDPRRAWAILLLYATGIRLASACGIALDDVHGDQLHLQMAKGDRPYSIHLGPLGRAAVAGLLGTRPAGSETLIGAGDGRVWEWVHQAGLDAGIRAHPHLFRHTWATRHLELGTDVRTLQELGNWADLSQIPRYTSVTDPRKKAAQERF